MWRVKTSGDLEDAVLQVRILAVGDVLRRAEDRQVDLLVAERDIARRRLAHDGDDHAVRVGHAGLVEFLPALGDEPRAGDMLDELERPEADRLLQEFGLVGFARRIDRGVAVVEIDAGVDAVGQRHFQREVVDLLQA